MTISPQDAATPGHIEQVLQRAGLLGDAHVTEVGTISQQMTVLSRIARLRITYDRAADAAPQTIILKTVHPERAETFWFAGRSEAAFYNEVAPQVGPGILLRCYEAVFDPDTRLWHLLLEDVTDSHHIPTIWPIPPTGAQCGLVVTAMARFHAALWDHPGLGRSLGAWADPTELAERFAGMREQLARLAAHFGDALSSDRVTLIERLLDAAPRLMQRYHEHRHVTVAHGDAHVWNCFQPRDSSAVPPLLFDWDAWRLELGTFDLAYMMAMHWYPDRRRRHERPLLDLYHRTLLENGVTGYDRAALDADYRWSTLYMLTTVLWHTQVNIPPVIWWNNLERLMLAIDDLDCRELLS